MILNTFLRKMLDFDLLYFFDELAPPIFTIIGTIIGVYVGYLLSKKHWNYQLDYQKKNIARGFFHELEDLQNIIYPIVEYYESPKFTVGSPYYLDDVIIKTNVDVHKNKSFYDNYGLYFIFHKEIYMFDKDLIKTVLIFYKSFLQAEECYKIYIISKDNNEKLNMQDYFFDYLEKSYHTMPKLQKSLKKYIKYS